MAVERTVGVGPHGVRFCDPFSILEVAAWHNGTRGRCTAVAAHPREDEIELDAPLAAKGARRR